MKILINIKQIILFVICASTNALVTHQNLRFRSFRLHATQDEPPRKVINIRFINNLSGADIVTTADEGELLLNVGDRAGVKLPRACRLGLCGSCTCELKDPRAIATDTNPRDGFATIRACSFNCVLPEGMDEMVVDVYRMQKRVKAKSMPMDPKNPVIPTAEVEEYTDPMARFNDEWEKEFRPQWELSKLKEGKGLVGPSSDPKLKTLICQKCQGAGRVICYACSGTGKTLMGSGHFDQCSTCVGKLTVGCGYCRGTGKKLR